MPNATPRVHPAQSRLRASFALGLLTLLMMTLMGAALSACNSDDEPPPTQIVIITGQPTDAAFPNPTAEARVDGLEETLTALQGTNVALQATLDAQQLAAFATPTAPGSATPITEVVATLSPTPTETALPSLFPTPRIEQVIVVEQVFERGRMFWFRENRKIWVVVGDQPNPTQGEWLCFEDTFLEGDPEFDPTLEPPLGATMDPAYTTTVQDARPQQPIRGFGKVWRDNPELRQRIGWALASEIEHNTRREYLAGGLVNDAGQYTPGTGEWRLGSFYNATFIFFEREIGSSCPSGTWRLRQ
jgi:hypothetical protein